MTSESPVPETTDAPSTETARAGRLQRWLPIIVPVLGIVLLVAGWGRDLNGIVVALIAVVLAAVVLAAVHHAEVLAHAVGEPFGSLILAVSVTVIEVSLIITLVTAGGEGSETLARDTVFAAIMITLNGIVGISLLLGAFKHGPVKFNAEGTGGALATVAALATLCLVVPTFTSTQGPVFSSPQLIFVAIASVVLYGMFVAAQTVGYREMFVPVVTEGEKRKAAESADHGATPTRREALVSLGLLLVSLVAVVGLAKLESPSIEAGVAAVGFPPSFVGVVIALLVLLPEGIAAVRAARQNKVQTSFNLALGSAMASIGLTIPAMAVASFFIAGPLALGLGSTQIVLLVLTLLVSILTLVPGRATRLQGGVHLVIFAAFIFLSISP